VRTSDSLFTFENRCLLCGQMIGGGNSGQILHLKRHIREGYLNDELEQIKPHPIGFPGPPLGQQPTCSSHT
jgi:hypothetical protein